MPSRCCQPGDRDPAPPARPPRIPPLPGELPASIAAGVLLGLGLAAKYLGAGFLHPLVELSLVWTSLAIGMVYGGRAALLSLLELRFDIDALMVVAASLAAFSGHPEDGALLLFLFTLSGALEDRAMRRTRHAVEALHRLMPTHASVRRDAEWVDIEPERLVEGDRILIRPGESVPADATIADGVSAMDQSSLTGESLPRSVGPGDELYAGSINTAHPIEALVLRPAAQSSLQRILNLVIEAQQQREPFQRIIDRLSQPYALGVVAISALVLLVWWRGLGAPLADATRTAITLLIVASPCALVIATPTATLAAISRAARAGVLFKGGQAIERLARLGAVCLDKTGTLTFGRPRLHQVHAVAWSEGPELLAVAAVLEEGSTHPIARAVVEAADARAIVRPEAREPRDLPGRGLAAIVAGVPARLGTYDHCEPLIPVCLRARVREVLDTVRGRGQIAVVVARSADFDPGTAPDAPARAPASGDAAVLVLSDAIRPGARPMVERLHALGVRPVRMLTGDNRVTAAHVANAVGIDQWDAELLPEDKVRFVEAMKRERRSQPGRRRAVGVIGDGVNDAPALAAADASIAIGSIGSDAALESADIVLLGDDLTAVPWAVRLARRARAIVLFNILLAGGIIVAMAIATLVGSRLGRPVPLPIAVLAHEGGTLLVVANSLRLLLAPAVARAPARDAEPGRVPAPVEPFVEVAA